MKDELYTYHLVDDGREYRIYRGRALVAGGYLASRTAAIEEAKRHIARLQRSDRGMRRKEAA